MYVLTANITIISEKNWIFEKVQEVKIERDINSLTDTCTITLPRKVRWKDEPQLPIKVGDSIIVRLGYNDKTQTVYCGYITSISAKGPLEIKCEDEMSRLKQTPVNTDSPYTSTTKISDLLAFQLPGTNINVGSDEALGAYRVPSEVYTVAQLLDGLRTNGFKAFFRYDNSDKPTLYCGKEFDAPGERVQVFDNRINMIKSDKLVYERMQAAKILIKGVSTSSQNKDLVQTQVGKEGGRVEVLIFHRKTEAEVKVSIQQKLDSYKQDGLTGSFTTFGACLLDKLDVIGVVLDGEKQGEYQVAKNTITYNKDGFRQEVTLGKRMDKK